MIHPLRKQLTEFRNLFNGYPEFVYSMNNDNSVNGIPVFVFHTIDPELFEDQLLYIKRNDYKTLSIRKFYDIIVTGKPVKEKYILLTIDDARSSVWRYAFPLLKKYDMQAAVFMIPGLTTRSDQVRSNLQNVWNRESSMEELTAIDPLDSKLCTWEELKVMYNSGLISIESHTLFHREVFSGNCFKGFITSDDLRRHYSSPATHYFSMSDIGKEFAPEKYIGLPVFETSPLMLCGPKLEISEELKKVSREIYFSNIPEALKKNKLKEIINGNQHDYIRLNNDNTQEVIEDLTKARQLIQSELDSKAGNHLCLPWTLGNEKTVKALKAAGIKSCFWGIIPYERINKPGCDPYYFTRIKNDFIYRLPGDGRKMLISIYNHKIKRRIIGEQVF